MLISLEFLEPFVQPIEKVAIVGAGRMGNGIAQKSAQERFDVQLVDKDKDGLAFGQSTIVEQLTEAIERKIYTSEQVEEIISRIEFTVGARNVDVSSDVVIEAVFEDIEIKSSVFRQLDETCAEHTIIATNTSSLSVDALAKNTTRPDRFVGLHFFYHPAKNRLVEVIPGEETSQGTLSRVVRYCKQLGKTVIVCKDRPGFVVNRFFVPWLIEAAKLVEEKLGTTAQIDAIARDAFNIGLGPFGLMNLTGPAIAMKSADSLSESLGVSRFLSPDNLREIVSSGSDWEISEDEEIDEYNAQLIRDRLYGVVFSIASQIVEEEVCSLEDVDRGAKVGLRWIEGPFELMNKVGLDEAWRMASSYANLCGTEYKLPKFFEERAESKEKFTFRYVDIEMDGSIARVKLNRPEAMNALNSALVSQLDEVMDELNSDENVTTIVFEGAGKAFVAGADVKFFVDKLKEDAFDEIKIFTEAGHHLLEKIEKSDKTTIALTTGAALGGGLEFALACDYRIGTRRTDLRFPETSIGIYPGLGGTQRTPRMVGVEVARWAVLAGPLIEGKTAKAIGLLTEFVEPSNVEETVVNLAGRGKPTNKYQGATNSNSKLVKRIQTLFNNSNMNMLLDGEIPSGINSEDPFVTHQMKNLSYKAPVALKLASKLIDISSDTNLDEGLKAELDHLSEIFGTDDALEGLSALIEHRRPSYQGK